MYILIFNKSNFQDYGLKVSKFEINGKNNYNFLVSLNNEKCKCGCVGNDKLFIQVNKLALICAAFTLQH